MEPSKRQRVNRDEYAKNNNPDLTSSVKYYGNKTNGTLLAKHEPLETEFEDVGYYALCPIMTR
jgi:hypothetical protein